MKNIQSTLFTVKIFYQVVSVGFYFCRQNAEPNLPGFHVEEPFLSDWSQMLAAAGAPDEAAFIILRTVVHLEANWLPEDMKTFCEETLNSSWNWTEQKLNNWAFRRHSAKQTGY